MIVVSLKLQSDVLMMHLDLLRVFALNVLTFF